MIRHKNGGLRKLCDCSRRIWAKCAHSWYLNFRPRGGQTFRLSLDAEVGRHLESKTEAEAEATRIKGEILAGTFIRAAERRQVAASVVVPATPGAITFDAFAAIYVVRVSEVRQRNKSWTNDRHMLAQLGTFVLPDGSLLGAKPLRAITEDDFESFMDALRAKGRAASTRNQYVQVIKASCRWAAKKGYLTQSPVTTESLLKRTKVAQRHRRLRPEVVDDHGRTITAGEEQRLLGVTSPRLQGIIVAALETACRRGELLALTWGDVNLHRKELTVRAETAKDGERRVLPISPRLAGVLEMTKTDPTGHDYPATAFVFGELGGAVQDIKRAWSTAVLKAHGHQPTWVKSSLSPASRTALKAIDLHFHDLRHEGASRMLEAGWPLHHIQHMLGHASLEQTSTYLNVEATGLHDSMRRFGVPAGTRCNSVAISEAKVPPAEPDASLEKGAKPLIN